MKRLILLLAAVALASCSNKSEEIGGATVTAEQDVQVGFTATISSDTRVTDDAFDDGDAIVVSAFDGSTLSASQIIYTRLDGVFTSSNAITRDNEVQMLSYIAAYPATISNFSNNFEFTVESDQSTAANQECSDLLIATLEATNETTPMLSFNHALSSLVINVDDDDLAGGTLTIYAKATTEVDLESMNYNAMGDAIALTPTVNSTSKYSVIFAPQEIAAGSVVAVYQLGERSYTWTSNNNLTFISGHRHNYTWTIDTDNPDPGYNGEVSYIGNIEEWNDKVLIDDVPATLYLADQSTTTYPVEDRWVILDETASTNDFAGFSGAIEHISINDTERRISVEFPNMEAIPDYAIFGIAASSSSAATGALCSVSADKATTIGNSAFYYCGSLETVDMPLLESIETYAFSNCSSLATVDMPLVESIGGYAFYYCSSLTTVDMPLVESIGTWALSGCSSLTTVDMPSVVTIGEYAFGNWSTLSQNNAALTTVNMPLVESIGNYAFYYCEALTTVDLPLVESIGDYAFYRCYALTTVDMPSVTTIGYYAFYSCTALTTMKLATGDDVVLSSVDSDAFTDVTTTNIDLTVGAANASLVSGLKFIVSSTFLTFKSITVL